MAYDTAALLTRIRTKARLSSSDPTYTDTVLFDIADEVLVEYIYPEFLFLNSDYFLYQEDLTLVSGRAKYVIPDRAYNNKVHSIYHLNSDKTIKGYIEYGDYRDLDISLSGTPTRHTIDDDTITLYGTPSVSNEYLRVRYYYTPSNLVASTACMAITGGLDTGVLTGNAPSAWSTALKYDIVAAQSPFSLIHSDLTASAVTASTSITFTLSDLDTTRLASGTYYVTQAEQTCFPMIPKEVHYILAKLTASKVLMDVGDEQADRDFAVVISTLKHQVKTIFSRKHSESKPFTRRYSPLRCRV